MLGFFKKKKLSTLPLSMRKAGSQDIEFIVDQMRLNFRKGHYGRGVSEKDFIEGQYVMLNDSIEGRAIQLATETGLSNKHSSLLFILESPVEKHIGFALILFDREAEVMVSEIISAGIQPHMRNIGCGKIFMQMLIDEFIHRTALKARCYKESEAMCNILKNLGFSTIKTTNLGTEHLYLERLASTSS